MSIRIGHGYRVRTRDINQFLEQVQQRLAPVRDALDAALYAELAVEGHDEALLGSRDYSEPTLREDTLARFMADVTGSRPGTVIHHPHSLDLDYAQPAQSDDTEGAEPTDGPWYVLLHAQRGTYHEAFLTMPGVQEYAYYNHTDALPDGVTEQDWVQRRADWGWLIDARTIGSVTNRWTYRDDPTPTMDHVTNPDVFTAHRPTRTTRAKTIARNLTCAEILTRMDNPQWEDVHDALFSTQRRDRATQLVPVIAAQLPRLDASALDHRQPDPITLTLPNLPEGDQ